MTAPSIKEALKAALRAFKACRPVERVACQDFGMQQDDILEQQLEAALSAALATFQPDGERREAIARIIDPHAFIIVNPKRVDMMDRQRWAREKADSILASGLVQDEAGWRPISTAPRDGTLVDVWSEDYGRLTDARYLLSEYTDGVPWGWSYPWRGRITDATHWKPLPAPPVRSARDGGEG